MKVRELMSQLQEFDPDAEVELFLNEVYVFPFSAVAEADNDDVPGTEYGVPFAVAGGFKGMPESITADMRPDAVTLTVTGDAVRRQLNALMRDAASMAEEQANAIKDAVRATTPSIATGGADGSAAVALLVSQATLSDLCDLVDGCNRRHQAGIGPNTHGLLTVPLLLTMLAEDAGMVVSRPGSWEGANMRAVLQGHGYV